MTEKAFIFSTAKLPFLPLIYFKAHFPDKINQHYQRQLGHPAPLTTNQSLLSPDPVSIFVMFIAPLGQGL